MKIVELQHPDGRKARVVVDGAIVTVKAVGSPMVSTPCKNKGAAKLLGQREVSLLGEKGFRKR